MRTLLAALILLAAPAQAAPPPELAEELRELMADSAREVQAHQSRLEGLAGEAEYRAEFLDFNARLDALQGHLVDVYRRMKAAVTAAEWETLPRIEHPDGTAQELLGFLQTYDAQASDVRPVLEQLRRETSARQEALIRARFGG